MGATAGSAEGRMSNLYYQDCRIEIRPCTTPGGLSAQIHIWEYYGGTTRMTMVPLPTFLSFATVEEVHAHAEKLARQWIDERPGAAVRHAPQEPALPLKP